MEYPTDTLRLTLQQTTQDNLFSTVVNAPFSYPADMVLLGIGIIVLLLCDDQTGDIRRVALSNTEMAEGTRQISYKNFEDIVIPHDHPENIIAHAIRSNEPRMTRDWKYLFAPALSSDQARLNQAGGAIACSYVYPLTFNKHKGALIFSYFEDPMLLDGPQHQFMRSYSEMVAQRFAAVKLDPEQLESYLG